MIQQTAILLRNFGVPTTQLDVQKRSHGQAKTVGFFLNSLNIRLHNISKKEAMLFETQMPNEKID